MDFSPDMICRGHELSTPWSFDIRVPIKSSKPIFFWGHGEVGWEAGSLFNKQFIYFNGYGFMRASNFLFLTALLRHNFHTTKSYVKFNDF